MTPVFTNELSSIFTTFIPNKIATFNDKDPPWITYGVKTAIKRKKRVSQNFLHRGRRQFDWELSKGVQNDKSRQVSDAKETYYCNVGPRLSDPTQGVKAYWTLLNRQVNKKIMYIPSLLENGLFITNLEKKASILNNHFVLQCSDVVTSSTLPAFCPRYRSLLEDVDMDREKVLKLI